MIAKRRDHVRARDPFGTGMNMPASCLGMALATLLIIAAPAVANSLGSDGASMGSDWMVETHKGIGRLQFGLTPEEVAATAPVYGTPSALLRGSTAAADVEAMIAELGAVLSQDDIAAVRQATEGQSDSDWQNLEKDQTPILLEYRAGRLDGVTVETRHKETHFRGEHLFSLTPQDVLRLFERANGSPGRFRSNEAAFDNLAVSLHAFSHVSAEGEARAATQADPDFQARSVTVRREPYRPADELAQFINVSFE